MQNSYATSTNRITNKTWHIVNGPLDVAVDPDEVEKIKNAFLVDHADHYELSDGTVIPRLGTAIMPAFQYEDYWHKKNGDFKCKENNWHSKGQKCECQPKLSTFSKQYCGKCTNGYIMVNTGNPRYPTSAQPCDICRQGNTPSNSNYRESY